MFEVVKGLCQQAKSVFASATSASSVITPTNKYSRKIINEMNKAVGMYE